MKDVGTRCSRCRNHALLLLRNHALLPLPNNGPGIKGQVRCMSAGLVTRALSAVARCS
jgi:hypothetical protein